MKILKQLLFTMAVMFCFSIAASAQNQDKKPPPKKDPPVVVVEDKKPKKEEKPKNDKDDRVKKPGTEFYLSKNQIEIGLI